MLKFNFGNLWNQIYVYSFKNVLCILFEHYFFNLKIKNHSIRRKNLDISLFFGNCTIVGKIELELFLQYYYNNT